MVVGDAVPNCRGTFVGRSDRVRLCGDVQGGTASAWEHAGYSGRSSAPAGHVPRVVQQPSSRTSAAAHQLSRGGASCPARAKRQGDLFATAVARSASSRPRCGFPGNAVDSRPSRQRSSEAVLHRRRSCCKTRGGASGPPASGSTKQTKQILTSRAADAILRFPQEQEASTSLNGCLKGPLQATSSGAAHRVDVSRLQKGDFS
jgi:hypothetical protein